MLTVALISKSVTVITVGSLDELKSRVTKLWLRAKEEQALLDEWLSKSDEQHALVEQKKARFQKLEKWNTVFAFNRSSRKKKSMLQNALKKGINQK